MSFILPFAFTLARTARGGVRRPPSREAHGACPGTRSVRAGMMRGASLAQVARRRNPGCSDRWIKKIETAKAEDRPGLPLALEPAEDDVPSSVKL